MLLKSKISKRLSFKTIAILAVLSFFISQQNSKVYAKESVSIKLNFGSNSDSTKIPLYILDGKVINKESMDSINPNDIESMQVFKGDEAIKRYGDSAKNGVIVISLKKGGVSKNDSINVEMAKYGASIIIEPIKIEKSIDLIKLSSSYKPSLYMVNDKVISKSDFELINKESVKRIEIYNSKQANEKFGDKAKDGAIVVITKN
jgi:hypothetical protein